MLCVVVVAVATIAARSMSIGEYAIAIASLLSPAAWQTTEAPPASPPSCATVVSGPNGASALNSPSTSVSIYLAGTHQRTVLTLHMRRLGVPPPPPEASPPPPFGCFSYDGCGRRPRTADEYECWCRPYDTTLPKGMDPRRTHFYHAKMERAMGYICHSRRLSDGSIEVDLVDYRNVSCSFGEHVLVTSVSCLPQPYHPPPAPPPPIDALEAASLFAPRFFERRRAQRGHG